MRLFSPIHVIKSRYKKRSRGGDLCIRETDFPPQKIFIFSRQSFPHLPNSRRNPRARFTTGFADIHPTAVIHPEAIVDTTAMISRPFDIDRGAIIGATPAFLARIIGPGAKVGERLHPAIPACRCTRRLHSRSARYSPTRVSDRFVRIWLYDRCRLGPPYQTRTNRECHH